MYARALPPEARTRVGAVVGLSRMPGFVSQTLEGKNRNCQLRHEIITSRRTARFRPPVPFPSARLPYQTRRS